MAKTKRTAPAVGLHLFEVKDGDYRHFGLTPVTIGRTAYEIGELDRLGNAAAEVSPNKIRNVSCRYDWDTVNGLDLDGLRIWSQGHKGEPRLYGWETEYHDVFSVDRARATRMAKTLNTIQKRMAKLADTVGNPKTFGQYVAHAAKAIGATKLVLTPKTDTTRGWSWGDVETSFRDFPREAIDHIDYQVDKWVEENRQKETV